MQKLEEKLKQQLNLAMEYDFPDVYLTIPVEEGKRLLELMSAKDVPSCPLGFNYNRSTENPERDLYFTKA